MHAIRYCLSDAIVMWQSHQVDFLHPVDFDTKYLHTPSIKIISNHLLVVLSVLPDTNIRTGGFHTTLEELEDV